MEPTTALANSIATLWRPCSAQRIGVGRSTTFGHVHCISRPDLGAAPLRPVRRCDLRRHDLRDPRGQCHCPRRKRGVVPRRGSMARGRDDSLQRRVQRILGPVGSGQLRRKGFAMLGAAVEYTKVDTVPRSAPARDAARDVVPTVFFAFEKRAQQWIKSSQPREGTTKMTPSERDSQWVELVTLANVILEEPAASERQLSNVLDVLAFFEPDRPWANGRSPTIARDGSPYFSALTMLADLWHHGCGIDRWAGEHDIRP
jgi:hypothetical protein